MKILVTGANGQLGYDLIKYLEELNIECLGIDIENLDITNELEVKQFILQYMPSHIIHCAAYTLVDNAENDREMCYKVNVLGTRYISESANLINSEIIYISTDYVFSGLGFEPFSDADIPKPLNYYGMTKYQGELEVINNSSKYYIIRVSWIFGINGKNFIKTMLELSKIKNELNVVSDQIGSPTYTYDLSRVIIMLMEKQKYGISHVTNNGFCSWYDFAVEIFKQANSNIQVNKVLTKDYLSKASRPLNSRMAGIKMRDWQVALSHFLEEYNNNNDR